QHFLLARLRNADDAVGVTADEVPRLHARVADVHRYLLGIHLHAVLAGAHGIAAAVDGIAQLQAEMHVAAGAVDDGAGQALPVGEKGEDVAPDGGILAPAVVDHHHRALAELVDEVAHRARLLGVERAIENGVGAAGQTEVVIARLDAEALTGDAQLV